MLIDTGNLFSYTECRHYSQIKKLILGGYKLLFTESFQAEFYSWFVNYAKFLAVGV